MANQDAASIFGGVDALAEKIVDRLSRCSMVFPPELLGDSGNHVETLQKFSRQRLLELFTRGGIPIDEVMPIDWGNHDRGEWLQKMEANNPNPGGIGSSGRSAPESLLLDNYVRWEALCETCGPSVAVLDEEREQRMQKLRQKYCATS